MFDCSRFAHVNQKFYSLFLYSKDKWWKLRMGLNPNFSDGAIYDIWALRLVDNGGIAESKMDLAQNQHQPIRK